ncbi:S-formylglutathione hydrolase [Puccinia graminis f. sp. tritici CRL 75-36-700-3]|uniref:ubiquitinyl hydrolase 1 n=1 Tax=Puccinia graminis f. sp. tritici (strain CRL 75-36-700-3 / race SCCL) TaxID=418459 RepID=E3KDF8_PUCGT|nr:S-formylglutathione hydrolase [Puccinia graminis f. sp. tritici CRL 75-36-700-3]EFP82394.2 S-formylglutathione hydrolase [Puccinia graminis f. sp. tritici CRL 75-36-700-3]
MVKEVEMDEIPSPQEQARLYHSFRSIRMATDQTWYLIHQQWFNTWSSSIGIATDDSTAAGTTTTTTDIPSIDNSDLLDHENQLRFGISIGIDCEIIPEEFWNLLVKWYGLKQPTHAIPRSVIAPSGPSSESVEFYPPSFIFHLILPSSNLEELESEQQYDLNLIRQLPNLVIQKRFSIGNSIGDLKRELTSNLLPAGLLTRSFKLWSIHSPPSNPNQLILSVSEFGNLETQLVEPSSGDAADLNEALLTDPVNVLAIEQQDQEGHWLINPKSAPPSTPPQLQDDDPTSSGPVFGGQEWLDRMEKMNQANLLDPKFSITSPNSDLSLVAFNSAQSAFKARGIRGLVGLTNLGNTCFMNSALQCLSNCPELKTYFLSRVYINELNRTNPLGMGGKVAETFGQLIERMWSSEYEVSRRIQGSTSGTNGPTSYGGSSHQSISPREFKSIVGRFNSLFLGYGQQDSQELLTFLLDALHEDLNRVKVKPFDEIPDYDDQNSLNDPLLEAQKILKLAKTCWNLYRRRNDSVIVDLFQGQYKSTLICPDCNKVAIKFDEIMYLTLQLPINKKFRGTIYFVPLDLSKPRIKVNYQINKDSTIRQLKQHIGQILCVDPDRMAAIEDWSGKPWKIWHDTDSLEGVMERDVINVFETPLPFAALKSGIYHTNGEEEEVPDLLIPVVSYRPAERMNMGSSTSIHKPSSTAFGVFFVARISAKDRLSTRAVYDAVAREYARYTSQAEELFERNEDEDVVMNEPTAEIPPSSSSQPTLHAVPNLFKISVPKTPCSTVFPVSNAMGNATIELEERVKLSASKAPPGPAPVSGVNEDANGSNGAVFEMEENEDLYEDKAAAPEPRSSSSPSHSSQTGPVVFEGDYFECEWTPSAMGHFFGLDKNLPNSKNWIDPPVIEDPELVASRVAEQNKKSGAAGELTIEECFKDFSKPEKLGSEDKWYCPRCKNHVQATKQMQIWKVPDILVVHFKRFSSARTSYGRSSKVDNFVDFPIQGLDLSNEVEGIKVVRELKKHQRNLKASSRDQPVADQDQDHKNLPQILVDDHLPSSSNPSDHNNNDKVGGEGKEIDAILEDQNTELDDGKEERQQQQQQDGDRERDGHENPQQEGEDDEDEEEEESLIYDLFAVDNHFGGLGGGHYTAFAKNEEDGKWHNYDDSHVTEVNSPERVKSSAAYLLFYRRRTTRKLGLKTHGIVSSAMQSRDISARSSSQGNSSHMADDDEDGSRAAIKTGAGARHAAMASSSSNGLERPTSQEEEEEVDELDEGVGAGVGAVGRGSSIGSVGREDGSLRSESPFSDLRPNLSRPISSSSSSPASHSPDASHSASPASHSSSSELVPSLPLGHHSLLDSSDPILSHHSANHRDSSNLPAVGPSPADDRHHVAPSAAPIPLPPVPPPPYKPHSSASSR